MTDDTPDKPILPKGCYVAIGWLIAGVMLAVSTQQRDDVAAPLAAGAGIVAILTIILLHAK